MTNIEVPTLRFSPRKPKPQPASQSGPDPSQILSGSATEPK